MRVALNLEQCFHRPPGGIGRYAAELARLLPDAGAPGEGVVAPFVARHSAREIKAAAERRPVPHRSCCPACTPGPLYDCGTVGVAADPLRRGRRW